MTRILTKADKKEMRKWLLDMEKACRNCRTGDIVDLLERNSEKGWDWSSMPEKDQIQYETVRLTADTHLY